MSTYEDVRALAELLYARVIIDTPALRWAQLGAPVLTCEGMAVGVTNVRGERLFGQLVNGRECQTLEVLDVTAIIGRACAFEANEDGTTNVENVVAASERADSDLAAMRAWADSLTRPPTALTNVSFVSEGAMLYVVLTTSVYAGWDTE